jgi:tetratricopeptide (TPR) repeat protein
MSYNRDEEDVFGHWSLRRALKLWHDAQQLGRHPLAKLRIVHLRQRSLNLANLPAGQVLALRATLRDALDRLRPHAGEPDLSDPHWYAYLILKQQYLDGRCRDYLVNELPLVLSNRTFHRLQNQGLARLGAILQRWESELHEATGTSRGVPFLAPPKPPHQLVGRYAVLQQVKAQFFDQRQAALCALVGLPGVGKTAVALELAHDPEVLARFCDGILWAGLGQQPQILALLGQWALSLGMSAQDLPGLRDEAQRAKALHALIGMRHLLFVIDDAWQLEAALALKLGGPNCAFLLTTRLPDIAGDFAGSAVIMVKELSEAGGLLLLEQLAPQLVRREPEEAQSLVRALGGLPLALVLAGRLARRENEIGSNSLQAFAQQLAGAGKKLALEMAQPPVGAHPSLPLLKSISLQQVIQITIEALDEVSRRTFCCLAIFAAKPSSFSAAAALAVTGEQPEALQTLVNFGLLEAAGPERFTLHLTISDYGRWLHTDVAACERLVAYYVAFVQDNVQRYELLDVEIGNILAALRVALQQQLDAAFAGMVDRLDVYIEARGLYQLFEPLLLEAEPIFRSRGDRESLLYVLLNLARVLEKRGKYVQAKALLEETLTTARQDMAPKLRLSCLHTLGLVETHLGLYEQAEQHYEEALLLARQAEDKRGVCTLVGHLGILAKNRGAYEAAESYYREGKSLAEEIEDRRVLANHLANLGILLFNRGEWDEAEVCYGDALAIARELGHRAMVGNLLVNSSVIAQKRGALERAESLLQEALALAQQSGHRERISNILANLGELARSRQAYAQANAYFEKALALARELEHQWLISGILVEWADSRIREGDHMAARQTGEEALLVAQKMDMPEFQAKALFSLAQAAIAGEDGARAKELAGQSLALFEQIGHYDAAVVSHWLGGLAEA